MVGMSDGLAIHLYKSSDRRFLTGVCSGIAEALDVSVFSIRLLFLLALLASGLGFVVYIMLSIFLPTEEEVIEQQDLEFFETAVQGLQKDDPAELTAKSTRLVDELTLPKNILAFVIILIGAIVLELNIVPWALVPAGLGYPILVMILGLGFVLKSINKGV